MKILIIRLSAIGDIVMSSPVATVLKQKWPNAQISWLTQPENIGLLEHHPDIDQLICWDKSATKRLIKDKKWLAAWRSIRVLGKQLKAEQFELCIDLQGLLKSGVMAAQSGAKRKIGLGSKEGSQWLMDEVISRELGDNELISSEYRMLCRHLGAQAPFVLKIHPGEPAVQTAKRIKHERLSAPFVVICPFTTRPQKHWFDDYWSELIERINHELKLSVVMLGGPADQAAADQISGEFVNLVGQTSLSEAAALIQLATGLVGVDTGLTHMGHAAQVPTLGLFGATKPYLKTGLVQSRVLHFDALFSGEKHGTREPLNGCMRDLTPAIAFEALNELIEVKPK